MAAPSQDGFSIHVTVWIDPTNVDKYMEHFKPAYDLVIAQPECLYFEMFQSNEDPGQLTWVENWSKSMEWFTENIVTKPEFGPYIEATTPMWVKPREIKVLKRWGPPFIHQKTENIS